MTEQPRAVVVIKGPAPPAPGVIAAAVHKALTDTASALPADARGTAEVVATLEGVEARAAARVLGGTLSAWGARAWNGSLGAGARLAWRW